MSLGFNAGEGGCPTLEEAIQSLYTIAVVEGKSTSTIRLKELGRFCIAELERRGLTGAVTEADVPGGGRAKKWDVVWSWHGKPRLVISLKSILQNPGGTVPNRIDDLMGEVANVQMYSPEIVTGYLMVFDSSCDPGRPSGRPSWIDFLRERLRNLSGRGAPSWSIGTLEASLVVEVDFSAGPHLVTPATATDQFFDTLVEEVRRRNPGIPSGAVVPAL